MPQYDVVICGLGVTGSAALHALAQRGRRVLGLDRFADGHDRASSHGETRIIRLAYFEHPAYVPLVRRAYALWRALEAASGRRLLEVTGIAEIGPRDGALVRGTLAAAREHGITHECLSAAELMRRYPAFRLGADMVGVVQPDGGFLHAEAAVAALKAEALRHGAEIRSGITVRTLTPLAGSVRIATDAGMIEAGATIVAAGPWAGDLVGPLLPAAALPLRVTRQVMGWFAPRDAALFARDRFPVFLIESAHGVHYGFPALDAGIKVAKHHHRDETVDPDHHDRGVRPADEALIRALLRDHLPDANGPLLDARTCLYTVAPDGDFIIDRLPDAPAIILASPCSGHGFKFAPAIGEALADLIDGGSPPSLDRFRLDRFR